jgi:hypothetical protein
VSQTEPETTPPAEAEERIRKIYAKDVKNQETVHTVFKATTKEKHHSRSGKSYLAVTLTDRTGAIDGRVFDNIDAADSAFAAGDYLLLKGKVGLFHGKVQIIIERLERLDPEPIDPAEFAFTAPAVDEKPVKPERKERDHDEPPAPEGSGHKAARQRLLRLLDHPHVVQALDVLLTHFEKQVEDRVVARLSGKEPAAVAPGPKVERKPRPARGDGPRHDARPRADAPKPDRDPSLPEGLAFKPFKALVGEGVVGEGAAGGGAVAEGVGPAGNSTPGV